jgi:hypothetical protein
MMRGSVFSIIVGAIALVFIINMCKSREFNVNIERSEAIHQMKVMSDSLIDELISEAILIERVLETSIESESTVPVRSRVTVYDTVSREVIIYDTIFRDTIIYNTTMIDTIAVGS